MIRRRISLAARLAWAALRGRTVVMEGAFGDDEYRVVGIRETNRG